MFARFFVDRPVFATVLSLVIVIIGGVALQSLPIAQYPEVVPPTVNVSATYPGASAKVVADTVAAPIEQEVNGVENMLYMLSKSTNDGQMNLDVTFRVGTNLDFAQVLTQNRVSIAEAKLPEEVKRQGVTVKKKSPMILLCVNLLSPSGRYDQLYLSNHATVQGKDAPARLPGVGDVSFLGARDYSMRVWLDPTALASRGMTAADVLKALQEQNVQVAAGRIGQPPAPAGIDFQYTVNTLGRLLDPEQFADIVVKTGEHGEITRLSDVGRVELGAKNYDVGSYLDGQESVTMAVFQLPGANALATAESVRAEMERLKARVPEGMEHKIVYDTTVFVDESIHEVYKTLFEAFVLVFIVVLVFLQDWRATLLPMIVVPVSLVGTFFVMAMLGFSLNNLSLFGLVLAIGIVVDDAIVVVENVERWMATGLAPREATIKALDEITGPVIAITLVLSSVFIPTAFITGISGQFYRQFALTIAASTIISAINAMTMAPARAVTLIKPHAHGEERREALPRTAVVLLGALFADFFLTGRVQGLFGLSAGGHGHEAHGSAAALWAVRLVVAGAGGVVGYRLNERVNRGLLAFFRGFNRVFERVTEAYGGVVARLVRATALLLAVYAGFMVLTWLGFRTVPTGFIPDQDKGYLVVNAQLPGRAAPALSRRRPGEGEGARRVAERRLPDPPDIPRLGIRQRLHALRTQLAGEHPGRREVPCRPGRHRAAQGPQSQRRDGPAVDAGDRPGHHRPGDREPLQHVRVGGDRGRHGAGGELRAGDRHDGGRGGEGAARDDELRVDGAHVAADPRGQHGRVRLRLGRRAGLHGALGPVRELVPPGCDHPDRAHVPARGHQRRLARRLRQQHLHAGRPRRPDRPGRQERDPDRRIREAAPGSGQVALRRDHRGDEDPPAADPHDLVRLHPRRAAARADGGRRRRDALRARHRRVLRHAWGHRLRHLLHAGLLRGDPWLDRPASGTATRPRDADDGRTRAPSAARRRVLRLRCAFRPGQSVSSRAGMGTW